ncbi:MAG TPA: asparagine synthase (glutamine-hydrolyzing) [Ignavibacteria bacterium]|nr:asparagine synthase (glutamine-hydrolyzing) [Ignavibacteria bacterium]
MTHDTIHNTPYAIHHTQYAIRNTQNQKLMCGINGILYLNNFCSDRPAVYFENEIRKMNEAIAHRGPDGDGMFISYPVCLGHRRLSIIDLSKEAGQPMFNEDNSIVLVYNGEIYNYKELIPDLKAKGHVFRTHSDSEVILHSYEEYGPDCINNFNGMWAFAIYDFNKNLFFASRDRFGVKPFYYFFDNEQFIFSSEIKAILKIRNVNKANQGKVFDYLAYGYKTNNGDTFFQDIHELKPAHNIIIKSDGKNIPVFSRYWNFSQTDKKEFNENNISGQITDLIYDSVKIRYRSDVPVSILLSGGLDSGIIAKVTDELISGHHLNEEKVTAFTAIFPGFIYDESAIVKEVLSGLKNIDSVTLSPSGDNLTAEIRKFIYGMGEPVFSTSSFAHYMLMKEISKHGVKVVLNGQGSDESWSGYGRYFIGYFLLDILQSQPHKFISQLNAISDKMKFSKKFILSQLFKAILPRRYGSYLRSKYSENIIDCLKIDLIKDNYTYFKNPLYSKFSNSNLSSYMRYNIQYQGFNQILHYEDHSSMQSSIEMRSPFIDYRLMELAFSLPDKMKMDNGVTKKILREIFKDKLPPSVTENHLKIGFMTPFDNWMEESGTKDFTAGILNSESFNSRKILIPEKIRYIFNNKKKYPKFPYWRIINLELWSQIYGINNL